MTEIKILSSSFGVTITLQVFTPDNAMPFFDEVEKRGFNLNTSPVFAWRGTTNNLRLDINNRRIMFNITNNLLSPNENLLEVFSILSEMGYDVDESIERIEITGLVSIKLINDSVTSFVPQVVEDEFKHKVDQIFNRSTKIAGIRILSEEPLLGDISKSPFALLLEPQFTDIENTKFIVQFVFITRNSEKATDSLKGLYESVKKLIMGFK